jgi:sugar phosphate isomerase/epimerase
MSGKRIMVDLSKAVHVSVPFLMLRDQYLPLVLENRISLEIGIDAEVLDTCPVGDLVRVAGELQAADLSCSLHAPFLDLSPGAIDPRVRRVSRERLEEVIRLVPIFRPLWVVSHAGYEARHYADDQEAWLANCVETFSVLLGRLEGLQVPLMVENVFEKEPGHLASLFQALPSPGLRFCLDVGHHRIYGQSALAAWIDRLGPYLGLLHLHDNQGTWDDHLALGRGGIDFLGLFDLLKARGLRPRITIEPHQEEWVRESLAYLAQHWPWP